MVNAMTTDPASEAPREQVHLPINLANWESRVPLHEEGYGLDRYRDDPMALSDVVAFDRSRLGDISGLDVVHLQCHIGTDTLSLHRLGARVTGLDFSPSALGVAARLASECDADIDWVQAELYDAVDVLGQERFDVVYTGIGALCWLPDIQGWARVVAGLLRPGGRLFIREGHPMLWSLCDPREDGLLVVEFPYFTVPAGTTFSDEVSYVDHGDPIASPESVSFNHGLGQILTAVTAAGLRFDSLTEHQSVPWNPLGDAMVGIDCGEYQLRENPERLAASYTLQATKSQLAKWSGKQFASEFQQRRRRRGNPTMAVTQQLDEDAWTGERQRDQLPRVQLDLAGERRQHRQPHACPHALFDGRDACELHRGHRRHTIGGQPVEERAAV